MDLLDTSALLETLPSLLPPNPTDSSSSSSSSSTAKLRQPQDALASLLHTILTRLDFRLVGLGEDHRLDQTQTESDQGTNSQNEHQPKDGENLNTRKNQLPKEWNGKGPDTYAFRYRHDQSSLEFIIKTVKLAGRVVVHGIAVEDNKTYSFEINIADYFSPSFFPWPSSESKEPLINGFISSSRVKDLTNTFKVQIVQRLIPGLRKDGYQETESGSSSIPTNGNNNNNNNNEQRQPPPLVQPNRPGYDPHPPEDDFRQPPFRNPLIIGDRDLDPLGGGLNNPLALPGRGGGGGMGGFGPPPLFGGGDNGGGMYVGPDHPMFRDRFQNPGAGMGGGAGPLGGQPGGNNFLPPGAVPPGARFDPIGPGGPFPNPRGGFNPTGGGRGRGDPDWNDVRPPSGNDFDHMFG